MRTAALQREAIEKAAHMKKGKGVLDIADLNITFDSQGQVLHVKRQDAAHLAGPGDRVVIKSQLNHALTEVGKSDILLALDKIKAG